MAEENFEKERRIFESAMTAADNATRELNRSRADWRWPICALRIRQCSSWCRDPPDRTTNDSHEGHQVVLQTELIDLHAT